MLLLLSLLQGYWIDFVAILLQKHNILIIMYEGKKHFIHTARTTNNIIRINETSELAESTVLAEDFLTKKP